MPSGSDPIRFGLFEVNLETGEIRRDGTKVRLQEQPFQVLAALLEKPGEIVTKEELQERIWKDDTFVDFDRSLATAINKVRQALGDSATRPQYIETVSKRGYRFIGLMPRATPTGDSEVRKRAPNEVSVSRRKLLALQVLAAALAAAFLASLSFRQTEDPLERPLRRFSISPPSSVDGDDTFAELAISPNGRHVAFTTLGAGGGALWVQDLDQDEPRKLFDTAQTAALPFWSPDSQFIGFAAGGDLRKTSVLGGASEVICPVSGYSVEGSWSPDGESIVFGALNASATSSLFEAPSQGGAPEELIRPADVDEAASFAARPAFVPSGSDRVLLFTISSGGDSTIYAKNLDTGQTAALGLGDCPIYSAATGHLIYQSAWDVDDLWARPFSPETLEFTGPQFSVKQNARRPSLSQDGTLTFLDGADNTGPRTLVWRNRSGESLETIGQPQQRLSRPALSPDGRRIAVISRESGNLDIWIHDRIRSTKTRLTSDEADEFNPIWSPSGGEVAYSLLLGAAGPRLMSKAADGTGEAVALVEAAGSPFPDDWSTDGRYLTYTEFTSEAGYDIRYVDLQSGGVTADPATFLSTALHEGAARFSPDGRFVAYVSTESGPSEVYVRPFPDGAGKWPVSANGGGQPRWRGDGKELYYVAGSTMMAVSVSTEPSFAVGRPQPLFESADLTTSIGETTYDVTADGQRFVTVAPVEGGDDPAAPPKIRVVQNWYEEFRDREE